jgi:hypothetical protein
MLKDLVSVNNSRPSRSLEEKLLSSLLDSRDNKEPRNSQQKKTSSDPQLAELLDLSETPRETQLSTLERKLREGKSRKNTENSFRNSVSRGNTREIPHGKRIQEEKDNGKGFPEKRKGEALNSSGNGGNSQGNAEKNRGKEGCMRLSSDYLAKMKALTENQDLFGETAAEKNEAESILSIFQRDNLKKINKTSEIHENKEINKSINSGIPGKTQEKYNPLQKSERIQGRKDEIPNKMNFTQKTNSSSHYSPLEKRPVNLKGMENRPQNLKDNPSKSMRIPLRNENLSKNPGNNKKLILKTIFKEKVFIFVRKE